MPEKIVWSSDQDNLIRRRRASGMCWETIAQELGICRWTVIKHAEAIGIDKTLAKPEAEETADLGRDPLIPGHPDSWGPLNRGTCIQGVAFPSPYAKTRSLRHGEHK